MRVGLPRELLSMERITLFKEAVDGLAPGFQWVHDPLGKGPEPIFLDGDACLPFKKMVRTSLSLLKDTDALILPRIAQLDGYLMCPNFRALPDIVNINRSFCILQFRFIKSRKYIAYTLNSIIDFIY